MLRNADIEVVQAWRYIFAYQESLGTRLLTLSSGLRVFIACSPKFCENFTLQVTNLSMKLEHSHLPEQAIESLSAVVVLRVHPYHTDNVQQAREKFGDRSWLRVG